MQQMMLQRQLPEAAAPFRRVLACGRPADAVVLLTQAAPLISGSDASVRVIHVGSHGAAALEHACGLLQQRGVAVARERVDELDPKALVQAVRRDEHDLVMKGLVPAAAGMALTPPDEFLIDRCPGTLWLGDLSARYPPRRVVAAVAPESGERAGSLAPHVLATANVVADHCRSELHLVHAWVPFGAHLLRHRATPQEVAAYIANARRMAQRNVDDLLAEIPLTVPLRREHVHLVHSEPTPALAREIDTHEVDMVVIGARGRRTRLARALSSSHVRDLLRHVRCSALVVKS